MKKKWTIFVVLILLMLIVGVSAYAYAAIRAPLDEQVAQAETYAMNEGVTEVTWIDYYHGTSAYYVVGGIDQEGIDVFMWVADDFGSHHMEHSSAGITPEEALAIVKKDVNVMQVQSVRLGYERDLPIYEITYNNEDNRKGYYYVTFADGTFMKKYQLRAD